MTICKWYSTRFLNDFIGIMLNRSMCMSLPYRHCFIYQETCKCRIDLGIVSIWGVNFAVHRFFDHGNW